MKVKRYTNIKFLLSVMKEKKIKCGELVFLDERPIVVLSEEDNDVFNFRTDLYYFFVKEENKK